MDRKRRWRGEVGDEEGVEGLFGLIGGVEELFKFHIVVPISEVADHLPTSYPSIGQHQRMPKLGS